MDDILRLVEKFMGHRIQKSGFSRNEIKNALRILLSYEDLPSDIKKSMDTILAWAVAGEGEYGIEKGEVDLYPSIPMFVTDEQLQKMIDEEDLDETDDDEDSEWD